MDRTAPITRCAFIRDVIGTRHLHSSTFETKELSRESVRNAAVEEWRSRSLKELSTERVGHEAEDSR